MTENKNNNNMERWIKKNNTTRSHNLSHVIVIIIFIVVIITFNILDVTAPIKVVAELDSNNKKENESIMIECEVCHALHYLVEQQVIKNSNTDSESTPSEVKSRTFFHHYYYLFCCFLDCHCHKQ